MVTWKNNYNPKLVVEKLEAAKIIQRDGKVSFIGSVHWENAILLQSMISLSEEIPDREKRRIINKAISKAGQKGKITSEKIIKEINKLQTEYLSLPLKKYQLITSISLYHVPAIKRLIVDGCHINFVSKLRKPILQERQKLIDESERFYSMNLPRNYLNVRIAISEKSDEQAVNQALDSLDFVRAVWNLFLNRSKGFRVSSGQRYQVNEIILGPMHTLHDQSGKLATETWWYEPEYREPVNTFTQDSKIEKMFTFLKKVRECLKRGKYAGDLKLAIVRYGRALDQTDLEASFLKLWGVLELLTDTVGSSYKVTVRRASYFCKEREYHKEILSHLRDHRNRSVHAGKENHDVEMCVYQLKRYVETLLEFHLASSFSFQSITHAAEFMDLPTDMSQLKLKMKMFGYAEKRLRTK